MRVFFDLYHLPQYNFFRNTIQSLGPGKVELGCVNRGKLVDIIRMNVRSISFMFLGITKIIGGPSR